MKLTSEELQSLYQEGTGRSATGRADCLTADALMNAATIELSLAERERVADHLATCSDCAQEFRVVLALKPWAEEVGQAMAASGEPVLGSNETAKWPRLNAVKEATVQRPTLWQRFADVLSPTRAAFALAASLLLILSLCGWLALTRHENNSQISRLREQLAERDRAVDSAKKSLDEAQRQLEETIRRSDQEKSDTASKQYEEEITRLRQTIDELSKPQLDVPIVDLDPGGAIRGGPKRTTEPATMIEVPRTANLITFILNFTGPQRYSSYEVEIYDQRGKQVWRGQSARQRDANSLNVTLSRRLIPDGRYLIKLFGVRDGKREPVAEYPLVIRYS